MINRLKDQIKGFLIGDNDESIQLYFSGVMKFIPLIIVGGFFAFTIILFAFGPLQWNVSNPLKLYAFLILCCIALTIGYYFAICKTKTVNKKLNINTNGVLIVCATVFLIMYIPTLITTTGKWYPDIVTGIMDTGKAYRITKYYNETANQFALYIRMLVSPLMIMVMPITLFFWSKLSKVGKLLGSLVILLTIFLSISQGVNKAVADFTSQIVLFLTMFFFSNTKKKSKVKFRLKILGLILLVCLAFFMYYANGMRNRVSTDIAMNEENAISDDKSNSSSTSEQHLPQTSTPEVADDKVNDAISSYSTFSIATKKENYILDNILPPKVNNMVTYLTSYLSHGYQGLSYAMDKEFTSTYGLGFSDFFRHNFLKVVGQTEVEKSIVDKTYQGKVMENAWPTGAVWSTFFVYPASDISFFGTILLVLLIGFLFGLSWKDALITFNPFAITTFWGFTTMIFYFSANNQMFQGGENFIGFSTMIFCWLVSRAILIKRVN